jgi:hypothetical protein
MNKKSFLQEGFLTNMIYLNVQKIITSVDSDVKRMVKIPVVGLLKFWLFWFVVLLITGGFITWIFWAFGHFILGR